MDQRHLAGVGNIYANEALFAAGIDPSKPARQAHARRITAGCTRRSGASWRRRSRSNGTTVRDYRTGTGEPGNFQLELLVYGREGEPCRRCGTRLTGTHTDRRPHHRLLPPLPIVSRTPPRAASRSRSPSPTSRQLRRRVRALAENRPAVYRMIGRRRAGSSTSARPSGSAPGCSPTSAPTIRTTRRRGFCMPRATSPGTTCPASSPPISASCGRSGGIRPHFNYRGNLTRRAVFIKVSGGPAPRVSAGEHHRPRRRPLLRALPIAGAHRRGGADPERPAGPPRLRGDDADGLRRPGRPLRPAAAGGVHAPRVRVLHRAVRRLRGASWSTVAGWRPPLAFLEGRTIQPIDRVVSAMQEAPRRTRPLRGGGALAGEVRAAGVAARRHQPGAHGGGPADLRLSRSRRLTATTGSTSFARAWCGRPFPIPPRRSSARLSAPWSRRRRPRPTRRPARCRSNRCDEILLLMSWFRAHPDALRRTTPLAELAAGPIVLGRGHLGVRRADGHARFKGPSHNDLDNCRTWHPACLPPPGPSAPPGVGARHSMEVDHDSTALCRRRRRPPSRRAARGTERLGQARSVSLPMLAT